MKKKKVVDDREIDVVKGFALIGPLFTTIVSIICMIVIDWKIFIIIAAPLAISCILFLIWGIVRYKSLSMFLRKTLFVDDRLYETLYNLNEEKDIQNSMILYSNYVIRMPKEIRLTIIPHGTEIESIAELEIYYDDGDWVIDRGETTDLSPDHPGYE